jgi:KDO2-lipid IV(A) lauroyltransferase
MVFLFSLIPFPLLYILSNALATLLRKIIKYRLSTISDNLDHIFPAISPSEKNELTRKIYLNLADITLEGIKGFSMSKAQIKKRHKVLNPDLLHHAYDLNKSTMLVTGHYGNWEWGAFSASYFISQDVIGFFKPLTNEYINSYAIKKRAKSGTILADINETGSFYKKYHDKNCLFLMAADQSPTKPEYAIWTEFLGINTPCVHGIEKYVEKYNLAVIYCRITRTRRGYYDLELEWITSPSEKPKNYGDTTKIFMQKLEEVIYDKPENWLWSHRRWKHINNKVS